MADNSGGKKLMQAFFAPAVALMSRLNVGRKFALLGLMSLVAMAVVVYSLFASLDQVIRSSQRELHGLELIKPFPRAVQMLQQHRGLSAGLLGGDEAMRDSRAGTESEAVEAFKVMEEKLPPGLTSGEDLRHIRADWERLRKDGFNWTAAENYAAHTRLIDRIQSFNEQVADDYALIMDPEISSYYLIDTIVNKLPHALEHLGQLRAYCTGILAAKQATPQQQTEINILSAKLGDAVKELEKNLDKAGRHNQALKDSIAAASRNISGSVQQLTGIVASNVSTGHFSARSADFFKQSTDAIDQSYAQLHETLLPAAETLLKARIARAESTLYFSIGIATLLLLMVAYFSVGISRAVVANIRSLACLAQDITAGNLNERVDIDTNDELGQVGECFNQMVCGFSLMLEASRRKEARLQDLSAHLEERVKERTVELELAQRETEALLRRNQALMMTSLEGVHVMDIQGNIVEANDAFCRMLGYAWEEVLGLNVAHWDAQWPVDELRKKFRELIGKSIMIETLHRRKDGTLIDVEISASGVELEGQNFIFALSRDITLRKRTEHALLESKALLATTFDLAIVGIARVALDGHWLEINQKLCDIVGYTREELLARTFQDITYPDDLDADLNHVRQMLSGEISTYSMDKRYVRKDGATIWVSISVALARHDDGTPDYFIAVIEDTAQRKQAEAALKQHKVIIDTAIDGFWMTDMMGHLQEANEAYAKISGYTVDELANMHISQLEALERSPEEVHAHIKKIIAQGHDRFETRHRHKDGHEVDIEVSVTYMHESQQFFAFCRDITGRKLAEEKIHHLAFYDALTKLPNRRLFLDRFRAPQ